MAHPNSGDNTDRKADGELPSSAPPGMPRWVKVSAIVVGVLILLVLIVGITGIGGEHGPGRHKMSSSAPLDVGLIQAVSTSNPGGQAPTDGSDR